MAEDNPTIVDLVNQARNGDPQQLNQLFGRCRNYVELLARAQVESWLQAKVDASDLVQQTMLDAHRDFTRFRGKTEGEWFAWLREILAHNAADFVRRYGGTAKRQARREVPFAQAGDTTGRAAAPEPADSASSPSQRVLGRERDLLVADAVARLPDDYREVILLRNLQRLPFDEVARRLGRSRPAAQMLWTRAIRKLQQSLAGVP